MPDLTYNISRSRAARILDVSTRTIDRYIKQGKLSYERISNRIMLSQSQVQELASRRTSGSTHNVSVMSGYRIKDVSPTHDGGDNASEVSGASSPSSTIQSVREIEVLDKRLQDFIHLIHEKDSILEKKSQTIAVLQHKIGHLEQKLSETIALPDHTQKTQDILMEKEKIVAMHNHVAAMLSKEKSKNMIFMFVMAVLIAVIIFVVAQNRSILFYM